MRKNLLVISMSIATVVVVAFLAFQNDTEQTYVPRSESNKSEGIKGAQAYYKMLKADALTGEINEELILQKKNEITAQLQTVKKSSSLSLDWEDMGPSNVGGRTRAILVLQGSPNTLFAGAVAGGLWKSINGGDNWTRVPSFNDNLAIGSIVQLGNGWIVVGTGSTFERAGGNGGSGFYGNGLFISKDNGATFSLVKDNANENIDRANGYSVFNEMVADPNNSDVAWMATSQGLRKVNFTTKEFTLPNGASSNTCRDVAISADGKVIIASYSTNVALSKDGGDSFEFICKSGTGNLKAPNSSGRVTLAISPDNGAYIYALMANAAQLLDGLYYTTDTGTTWASAWAGNSADEPFQSANGQGFYDNDVSVIPGKPGVAVVAGVTLWIAGPAQQPEQIADNFGSLFSPFYVHSDLHELTWANATTLYIGCDGGIHKGTYANGSFTFQMKNTDYNVTQFYEIGIDGQGKIIGGTQDNGTQYVEGIGASPKKAVRVIGGDGFTCDLSVLLPNAAIGSVYNGDLNRSQNVKTSGFSNFVQDIGNEFGGFNTLGKLYEKDSDGNARKVLYTYTNNDAGATEPAGKVVQVPSQVLSGLMVEHTLDSALKSGKSVTFYDKTNVMYIVDDGSSLHLTREIWNFETTPDFWRIADNVYSNQLAYSHDGDHIFSAGFGITRVSGLRNAWNANDACVDSAGYKLTVKNSSLGGGLLTDVAVDRSNADHVIGVKPGYNTGNHIYESFNATSATPTYVSIDGDFPDIPVYAVEIDHSDPSIIYIGSEEGLYVTEDGGVTWVNQTVNGFERTPVFDIRVQNINRENVINKGVVYVGTHGRGFFKMENRKVAYITDINENVVENNFTSSLKIYPNPVTSNATIAFEIAKNDHATLSILNLTGQMVKTIDAGNLNTNLENKITFSVSDLPVGSYLVHLNNGTDQRTGRFVKTN